MTTPDIEKDDDFTAAEFALGTLDTREHALAARRVETDPAFAADVESWHRILMPLIETVPAQAPPPAVWTRIAQRTQPGQVPAESLASRFWRWLAIGSLGVAVASLTALFVVTQSLQGMPEAAFNTVVASADGSQLAVITVDGDGRSAMVTPLALPEDPAHSTELWLIPEGGNPRSLGLVSMGAPVRIALAERFAPSDWQNGTLAVSLEPAGGSPTGLPTGPVLGGGVLTRL